MGTAVWAGEQPAGTEQPAAATTAEARPTMTEAFARAGIKLVSGPAEAKLGSVAQLKLPAGYHFVGPDSLDKFYELTRNVRSGNEVGVLLAPAGWTMFFDYDDTGYVKDSDKDQLDAGKLMESMSSNQEAANEDRKKRGWDEMKLKGWATEPHYDTRTNNLKWAINLASSRDGFKEVWINENIRLLGRGGVMNVTLVSDMPAFKQSELEADQLLAANFEYVSGQKYAEYKSGDKLAQYGLAALVLGGAGAAAVKMGLFAKLAAYLGKAWKLVVVAFAALATVIKRIWNKFTGARPDSQPPA